MDALRRDLVLLLLLFALVAAVRVTAPSDLATGDQPYQAAYIRDVVERGAWIVQHLEDGTPASKPPLYNWLAAGPILIAGSTNEFLLKLPSLLAGLGTLLLTYAIGRATASPRTALFAGVLLTCSTMFSKQIYFARTDMLLTFFIAAQIWAAMQKRPLLLWTAAALSLLSKGPIGVVIPLLGLAAWWWREGVLRDRMRELHVVPGLVASCLPLALWFAAALHVEGAGVWEQLVVRETVDRFAPGSKSMEHRHILYYIPHFLGRMAPASLLATAALFTLRWRRRGAAGPLALTAWWLIAPFLLLSLVPSKRADRLFPLFPAVCILAAWAIDQWLDHQPVPGTGGVLRFIAILAALGGMAVAIGVPMGMIEADAAVRPPVIAAGILLTGGGLALLAAVVRRNAPGLIAALAVTMLVIIAVYQHRLSEPARGATLDQLKSTVLTLPSRIRTTQPG